MKHLKTEKQKAFVKRMDADWYYLNEGNPDEQIDFLNKVEEIFDSWKELAKMVAETKKVSYTFLLNNFDLFSDNFWKKHQKLSKSETEYIRSRCKRPAEPIEDILSLCEVN